MALPVDLTNSILSMMALRLPTQSCSPYFCIGSYLRNFTFANQ